MGMNHTKINQLLNDSNDSILRPRKREVDSGVNGLDTLASIAGLMVFDVLHRQIWIFHE